MASPRTPKTTKAAKSATKAEGAGVLFVRDADICADLDGWAEKLNAANPDAPAWTRSSLARAILRRSVRERAAKGEAP